MSVPWFCYVAVPRFPAEFAANGIDALLTGFAPRTRYRLRADPPRTLAVHTAQAGAAAVGDWLVRIGPERTETSRQSGPDGAADGAIQGAAADLYPLLSKVQGGPAGPAGTVGASTNRVACEGAG